MKSWPPWKGVSLASLPAYFADNIVFYCIRLVCRQRAQPACCPAPLQLIQARLLAFGTLEPLNTTTLPCYSS
jgi:hypothetical protein